jgi:hypothetical protein
MSPHFVYVRHEINMRCGPGLKQPIGIIHKNVVWLWTEADFVGQSVNQGRIDEITLTILVKSTRS